MTGNPKPFTCHPWGFLHPPLEATDPCKLYVPQGWRVSLVACEGSVELASLGGHLARWGHLRSNQRCFIKE